MLIKWVYQLGFCNWCSVDNLPFTTQAQTLVATARKKGHSRRLRIFLLGRLDTEKYRENLGEEPVL